jgi:hypothetical protein
MSESELRIQIPKPKGKVRLDVLIHFLERHLVHLHEVYTLSKNIDITNIMLAQITKLGTIIDQLKSCQ